MDQLNNPPKEFNPKNPSSIQAMFGAIAGKYDLANTVLSMGIHHSWKNTLVRQSGAKPGDAILDCATGTGDLAFRFEKKLASRSTSASLVSSVIGSDFCEPMLEVARTKAAQQRSQVTFVQADVMKLPFENSQFDVVSISFGIRNVKDTSHGIKELGRVLKPGGRLMILEFGQPQSRIMAGLFGFYSNSILPRLGGWVSGQPQAYRYLQSSSATFPCGNEFTELARSTGLFKKVTYQTFQGGIAYLYCLERV